MPTEATLPPIFTEDLGELTHVLLKVSGENEAFEAAFETLSADSSIEVPAEVERDMAFVRGQMLQSKSSNAPWIMSELIHKRRNPNQLLDEFMSHCEFGTESLFLAVRRPLKEMLARVIAETQATMSMLQAQGVSEAVILKAVDAFKQRLAYLNKHDAANDLPEEVASYIEMFREQRITGRQTEHFAPLSDPWDDEG